MSTCTTSATTQSQSPSDRNKDAITEQLKLIFQKSAVPLQIFEVGSGEGVHVLHFAKELPHVHWHPSDYNEATIQCHSGEYVNAVSILDVVAAAGSAAQPLQLPSNVADPIFFDVTAPIEQSLLRGRQAAFDGVLNINMLHIAPWIVAVCLFRAAGFLLKPATGLLVLYGAFSVDGVLEPESNVQFDKKLKEKNPEWGVRDVQDLKVLAGENGLVFDRMVEMPSNNKILVFHRIEQ